MAGNRALYSSLGSRTECRYCGTDLHLPKFAGDANADVAETVEPTNGLYEQEPPARATRSTLLPLLAVGVALALLLLYLVRAAPSVSAPEPTRSPAPTRDPELERTIANAKCRTSCMNPCTEIKDPASMVRCMDGCEDKCKYVGKGSGADCRARCRSKCSTTACVPRARAAADGSVRPDPAACRRSCTRAGPSRAGGSSSWGRLDGEGWIAHTCLAEQSVHRHHAPMERAAVRAKDRVDLVRPLWVGVELITSSAAIAFPSRTVTV
jgi:hypothetical protein